MKLKQIISGGALAGHRTFIISGIGILTAVGAYLTGLQNIFEMLNAIYPLAGIYFLRRGMDNKRRKNGSPKKVSE
ncbi:MAG: hypothetical protein LBO08_01345 [Rickettsiales bacterium]|jgi:hypothetical protein|nr:hypothetical protein [Rickettsiales bacterium]